jgi:glycosyltransferase involved in cell wall biosynthesis
LPEVVGDAGLLIPPADPAALAAAIAQLLADPAKRAELGALARQRILEKFNWKGAAMRTVDVYSEAIEAKRSMSAGSISRR